MLCTYSDSNDEIGFHRSSFDFIESPKTYWHIILNCVSSKFKRRSCNELFKQEIKLCCIASPYIPHECLLRPEPTLRNHRNRTRVTWINGIRRPNVMNDTKGIHLNCFELVAPYTSCWRGGIPYRQFPYHDFCPATTIRKLYLMKCRCEVESIKL